MNPKIDKKILEELREHNISRINKTVEDVLLEHVGSKILLAMDFDECALTQHASRLTTNRFFSRSPIPEEFKKDDSVYGIAQLFNCYVDLKKDDFDSAIYEIIKGVTWRDGFVRFSQQLTTMPNICPVFISSGLTDVCLKALGSIGVKNTGVIADEFVISNNVIEGPYTVVGEEEKGYVVERLMRLGGFEKCVSVGHSSGDIYLIKAGSLGYRLCFDDAPEVIAVSDHKLDSWLEVLKYLK